MRRFLADRRDFSPDPEITEKGDFNDLFLGHEKLAGHVDAVHAQSLDKEQVKKIITVGTMYDRGGREIGQPASNKIYLNESVRDLLKVAIGGSITFANQEGGTVSLKVDGGRKSNADDKDFSPIIISPRTRSKVENSLVEKIYNSIKEKARRENSEYCLEGDKYTGDIAKQFCKLGGSGIVSRINRLLADENRYANYSQFAGKHVQRKAVTEYRSQKRKILEKKGWLNEAGSVNRSYLHIGLHGKADRRSGNPRDCDVEIGTRSGELCDKETMEWFKSTFKQKLKERKVNIKEGSGLREVDVKSNVRLQGDPSKIKGPEDFGPDYKTIQLEVCRYLRENYPLVMAEILHEIMEEFTESFN